MCVLLISYCFTSRCKYAMKLSTGYKHLSCPSSCQRLCEHVKSFSDLVRITDIKLFVTINGLIGDISASFKFNNNFTSSGAAVFLFPLTHNASVKQCHAVVRSPAKRSRSVKLECHSHRNTEQPKVRFSAFWTSSICNVTTSQL